MYSSTERGSHDNLLQSRQSKDFDLDDFRKLASTGHGGRQPTFPYQDPLGLIEPLTVHEIDIEADASSLWNRFQSSRSCICRKRSAARLRARSHTYKPWRSRCFGRRIPMSRCILYLVVGCLSFLGLKQLLGFSLDALESLYPDDIDWILHHWGLEGYPSEGFAHWPTDATRDIHPVNCHSHNDYWRSVPLYAAIYAGCTGAEADVWLADDELFVGHRRYALTVNRTLRNLYLDPLMGLLEKQNPPIVLYPDDDHPINVESGHPLNGVFDVDPSQTFVLLIDFKTSGPALWWQLIEQLAPLREKGYLTHFNGTGIVERPITVVGTGNAPFDFLTANETYRDVFFDAPLDEFADLSARWPNPNRAQDPSRGHPRPQPEEPQSSRDRYGVLSNHVEPDSLISDDDQGQGKSGTSGLSPDTYNTTNSYYASASFTRSIGHVWGSRLTQEQLQRIRGHIRGAHQRGMKVRYWSLPMWPIGLRNHVWHILMREGVDMLNVDDLRHATRRDWRRRRSWEV